MSRVCKSAEITTKYQQNAPPLMIPFSCKVSSGGLPNMRSFSLPRTESGLCVSDPALAKIEIRRHK